MSKTNNTSDIAARAADYCRDGELAAHYMHGLADALEAVSMGDRAKSICHHLRHHAEALNVGTLWVEHEYRETP